MIFNLEDDVLHIVVLYSVSPISILLVSLLGFVVLFIYIKQYV